LIGAVLAVLFPLVHFILNPKNIAKVLVSLGALAAVFVAAYLLSDTTPIVTATSALEPNFSDPSVLKLADTGIIATYILLGTALLALLVTGVRGIFNR
jgi:membrane associated rhomboid family serine protease